MVIEGVAIMTTSKKFNVDSITENDIPLAIGTGIRLTSVMAVVFSTLSPLDLLEEIDRHKDKKQKENEGRRIRKRRKVRARKFLLRLESRRRIVNEKKETPKRKEAEDERNAPKEDAR